MAERTLHLDDARCSDLVLDLLTFDERRRAMEHASSCLACATRLRSHVSAVARMRADQPKTLAARPQRWSHWSHWTVGPGIAAAAAILLLVWWPHGVRHLPARPTSWLAAPSDDVLLREGQAEDLHLAAGLAAYARHDLVSAQRELSAAHASETAEQARRLYLAHVFYLNGDVVHALELLRSLSWIELPAAVHRDAVGLLAEALRATGHPASADSLDHALRATPEWVPFQP